MIRRMKRFGYRVARRLWRELKQSKIVPQHIDRDIVLLLRRTRVNRALLMREPVNENERRLADRRQRKLMARLSTNKARYVSYVRTLSRAARFDLYDLVYAELLNFAANVPRGTRVPFVVRERLSRIVIKSCLRMNDESLARQILSLLAGRHTQWLRGKILELRTTDLSLPDSEFAGEIQSLTMANENVLLERRAGYLLSQGNVPGAESLYELIALRGGTKELPLLRHNLDLLKRNQNDSAEVSLDEFFDAYGLVGARFPGGVRERSVLTLQFASSEPHQMAFGNDRVTVIFPVRNAAETIRPALLSILNQTHRNIEVIVVDDCSSDDSVALAQSVLKEYPHVPSHVVTNPTQMGPFVARNIGVKLASGSYVTFNDADDISHPQRLEKHLSFHTRKENFHFSTSRAVRLNRSGGIEFQAWHPHRYMHVAGATLFARRETFDSTGLFEAVRYDGDFEFSRRLDALVGSNLGANLPLPLYVADLSNTSLTTSGEGSIDPLRRNAVRLTYHRRLFEHYGSVDDLSALALDGYTRVSHVDYSDLDLNVVSDEATEAFDAISSKLFTLHTKA